MRILPGQTSELSYEALDLMGYRRFRRPLPFGVRRSLLVALYQNPGTVSLFVKTICLHWN